MTSLFTLGWPTTWCQTSKSAALTRSDEKTLQFRQKKFGDTKIKNLKHSI